MTDPEPARYRVLALLELEGDPAGADLQLAALGEALEARGLALAARRAAPDDLLAFELGPWRPAAEDPPGDPELDFGEGPVNSINVLGRWPSPRAGRREYGVVYCDFDREGSPPDRVWRQVPDGFRVELEAWAALPSDEVAAPLAGGTAIGFADLPESLQHSLRSVVNYCWDDEREDYLENCTADAVPVHHIFNALRELQEWITGEVDPENYPENEEVENDS